MKYLNNPFKKHKCEECGKNYDYLSNECPACSKENPTDEPYKRSFNSMLPLGPWREIILFLIGLVVLTIVANIIGTVALLIKSAQVVTPNMTQDELNEILTAYSESASYTLLVNDLAYTIIFAGMVLFLWKDNVRLFKSFLSYKVLVGLGIGLGMILLSSIWSMIANKLGAEQNINQGAVESTVIASPALAILVTGLVAPFVEELTYRVGAFTFLKRINVILAYVVVGALFGLIHIKDFSSVNEWLSYPSYVIAGLCLSFAYHKFGFAASFSAHAFNNLLSIALILAEQGK